jgi:flotillin
MNGIKSMINGTAQIKIDGREEYIHVAAEQFLGKSIDDIRQIALKTIEGLTRTIIGSMNLETINRNRREFTATVQEELVTPFNNMGLKLISYNLKEIKDPMGYLEALGKPQIAEARKTAEVAEAENTKEAIIKSAAAQKEGDIAKLQAETEVAEAQKEYEVNKSGYQAEVNQKRAHADYTYDLEKSKMEQLIRKEEYALKLIEKEQSIELEIKEVERKEKELISTVQKPAEAERFRLEMEAQGMAEAKRVQGMAEADAIKTMGIAEAETLRKKAESYEHFNQAAVLQMFFNILPNLAREITEPLSKVDKIVMVDSGTGNGMGASKLTSEVASIMAQMPTVVESLSGVDLKKFFERLPSKSSDSADDSSPETSGKK